MRIKHMIITGMALTTLFGCGANNSESMNNRQLDQIENVKNQPSQRQFDDQDSNQMPSGPRAPIGQNQNNRNDRTDQNAPGGDMFGDGRVDQGDDGQIDDRDNGQVRPGNGFQGREVRNNRENNRQSGNQTATKRQQFQDGENQQGEYRVSEQIADQVTSEVDEIDSAYVLTMGNNAYVACQLDNDREAGQNNDLSDKIERKVTETVKSTNDNIENVYVTSNPDFIDLTSNYMNDIDRGEPIEGFFDQFTEMIDRVFPTRNR